jgi:predicted NAD/FAD-binding protein
LYTLDSIMDQFRDNYILPMTAAVWSTPLAGMLDFPIFTLVHFMHNHYMLQIDNRPRWRTGVFLNRSTSRVDCITVSGGSKEYVKKIREQLDRTKFGIKLHKF